VLNVYKKEMNAYVENGLGSNLRARLSTALAMNIETAQREMTDRMTALVPKDTFKEATQQIITARNQPFEMLYTLNCQNLCSDFQEELEFRFSWGITALIQRFNARKGAKGKAVKYRNNGNLNMSQAMTPTTDLNSPMTLLPQFNGEFTTDEQLSLISRIAAASIGSQGTVGGLIIAGILFKTIGWRVLLGVGGVYLTVYAYERLSWTNKAKERKFKDQYVRHATRKLKLIVDLTSANCSHQVQQELSSTFARLCRVVDNAQSDMNTELKEIETSLNILEANQKQIKLLRNKASYITNKLDTFENNYIKSN